MTTPNSLEARAEKIHGYVCGCHFSEQCLSYILAELKSVEAEALERAAKVAENESKAYAGKALLASDACADVANEIRSLKSSSESLDRKEP